MSERSTWVRQLQRRNGRSKKRASRRRRGEKAGWRSPALERLEPRWLLSGNPDVGPRVTSVSPAPGAVLAVAPSAVTVTFDEPVDTSTLSRRTCHVVGSGGDGTFHDGNEVGVLPKSVTPAAANGVRLDFTGVSLPTDEYQVVAESALGNALQFDGTGDYVAIGNFGNRPTQGTISFWMRADAFGIWRNVLTTSPLTPYVAGNRGIRFEETPTGVLSVVIGSDDATDSQNWLYYIFAGSANPLQLNRWYHVALVWDSATNHVTGYLDGNPVFSETHTLWPSQFNDVRLGVGFDASRSFKGALDDVQFWSVAHNADQVRADLLAGARGTEPGLMAYWSLDEGTGQIVHDLTPNHRDGTLGANGTAGSDDPGWSALPGLRDTGGDPLNGEFTAGFPPSGDDQPGGAFVSTFALADVQLYALAQGGTELVALSAKTAYDPADIGPTGVPLFDIAASPRGELFGVSPEMLYRLDSATGRASPVGPIGFGGANALEFAADGTLYAATWNGDLLRLDPASGAGTRIGALPAGSRSAGDLAVDPADSTRLLFADTQGNLGWVDPATGSGAILGATGFSRVDGLDALGEQLYAFGNSPAGAQLFALSSSLLPGSLLHSYANLGSVYGLTAWTTPPANVAPVADSQSLTTTEDTPLPITFHGSNADGDPLSFAIWSGPRHGTVTGTNDRWTYTPGRNYFGADSFLFVANDGQANSPPATVAIAIAAVNDAPAAQDFQITVWTGETVTIPLPATDVDDPASALSYGLATAPHLGTLGPPTGSQLTYTAGPVAGSDSFTWYADDGHDTEHRSNTATVSITIRERPDLDLVEQQFAAPDQAALGDVVHVTWAVANNGPGLPGRSTVTDAIYLSSDEQLDPTDICLGVSKARYIDNLIVGGTYAESLDVKLPGPVRTGPQYLLVYVDNGDRQPEADETNNVAARPFTVLPSIKLTAPFDGRFVDRTNPVLFQWADIDDAYSGTVSLVIDTDADPANGETVLVQDLPEDADGTADQTQQTLGAAGIGTGTYYVRARLTDAAGSHDSPSIPIRVFDLVSVSIAAEDGPTAGNYYVLGAEAGIVDDEVSFRIRTNYPTAQTGTDVYVNVGGDFRTGTGRVFGIPLMTHPTETTGKLVEFGYLHKDARFLGGTVRHQFPVKIDDWQDRLFNVSTVTESHPSLGGWVTEIVGSVLLSALEAFAGSTVQFGWGPRCANGYDDVIIRIPGQDLAVTAVRYRPDENVVGGIHESAEPGREAAWEADVANLGTQAVTGAWELRWFLSTDDKHDASDKIIDSQTYQGLPLGPPVTFTSNARVPILAPEEQGSYYVGAVIIPAVVEGRNQNDVCLHKDYVYLKEVPPDGDDDPGDNDLPGRATNLGEMSSGRVREGWTIDATGDDDWYRIHLPKAGTTTDTVTIRFVGEQGDLDLYVYDPNNPLRPRVSAGRKTDEEKVSLERLAAGDYLIKVTGVHGDVSIAYTLECTALVGPWITHSDPTSAPTDLSWVDVTFNEPIRANTFSRADVTLRAPAGSEILTDDPVRIADNVYRITFPNQTAPGKYLLELGPWIEDLDGNSMDQNADGICGDSSSDTFRTAIYVLLSDEIQITLTGVTDGNGKSYRVFKPTEDDIVRLTFRVTNYGGAAVPVECLLNLRRPNNKDFVYEHPLQQSIGQLPSFASTVVTFDWPKSEWPIDGRFDVKTTGLYDVQVTARNATTHVSLRTTLFDETGSGSAKLASSAEILYDAFFLDPPKWSFDDPADSLIGLKEVFEQTRLRGYGQTVAVIDTGIDYTRVELGGDGEHGFGPGYRVVGGVDYIDANDTEPDGPLDKGDHGTKVAEVIGGTDPDYPGIAPAVRFVALRIFDGEAKGDELLKALDWVLKNHDKLDWPITTVNISGGYRCDPDQPGYKSCIATREKENKTLEKLYAAGISVFAAVGNDYRKSAREELSFPASSEFVSSVGATWSEWRLYQAWEGPQRYEVAWDFLPAVDYMASFSQRSETLDVVAPGTFLRTPVTEGGNDGLFSETSAAAPVAAGASVLVRGAMREYRQLNRPAAQAVENALVGGAATIWDVERNGVLDGFFTPISEAPAVLLSYGEKFHDNVLNTNRPYARIDLAQTLANITGVDLTPQKVALQGQLRFETTLQSGQYRPIAAARYELASAARGVLADGFTDQSGHYEINLGDISPQTGEQFHLRVYSQSPAAVVHGAGVTEAYAYDLADIPALGPGINTFHATIPWQGPDGTAFAALDAITGGLAWLENLTDYARQTRLDIVWPSDQDARFNPTTNSLVMSDDGAQDAPNHLRECALAVLQDVRGGDLPDGWWDARWVDGRDPLQQTDPAFAFAEGWADFFASAVSDSPAAIPGLDLETNRYWMGRDGLATGVNADGNAGAVVEAAVASILWDAFDGSAGDDDGADDNVGSLRDRFWLIWNVLTNTEGGQPFVNNIDEFYLRWRYFADQGWEEYGQTLPALERIFVDHGIRNVGQYVFDDVFDTGAADNDTQATAAVISDFAGPALTALIAADEDWYRLDLPSGTTEPVRVAIDFKASQGGLDVQVLEYQDDALVASFVSSGGGNVESSTFTPEAGRTYYARVFGFGEHAIYGEDDYDPGYYPDFSPSYRLCVQVENAAPQAVADPVAVWEDGSTLVRLAVGDDGPLSLVSGLLTALPAHGRLFDGDQPLAPDTPLPYLVGGAPGRFTLTYRPDQDFAGADSFSFQTADGHLWSNSVTIPVQVTPINDAPGFAGGPDQFVAEDPGPQTVAHWAQQIAAGPAAETGQWLAFQVTCNRPELFTVLPAIAADGTLTYQPAPDANGAARVTVTLADDGGTEHGGSDTSPAQTFTITVNPVNDAPRVDVVGSATVNEDTMGAVAAELSLVDPDASDAHTLDVSDRRFVIINDRLQLRGGERLDYETEPTVNLTVTVTDSGTLSFTRTLTVTVRDINDPPTAVDLDNAAVRENWPGMAVGNLWVTDEDVQDDHAFTLTTFRGGSEVPDGPLEIADGKLKLRDGVSLDEDRDATLSVRVAVTDGGGLSVERGWSITVVRNDFPWQNPDLPCDVDRDGRVLPVDVLLTINEINARGNRLLEVPPKQMPKYFFDTSGDNQVGPLDVLDTINYLNLRVASSSEGESAGRRVRGAAGAGLDDAKSIRHEGSSVPAAARPVSFAMGSPAGESEGFAVRTRETADAGSAAVSGDDSPRFSENPERRAPPPAVRGYSGPAPFRWSARNGRLPPSQDLDEVLDDIVQDVFDSQHVCAGL